MDEASKRVARTGGVLVALVVVLVFGPSLFGGFVWDDHALIANNAYLRESSSLWRLISTPFWAQYQNEGIATSPLYSWLHRPLIKLFYYYGRRTGVAAPFVLHSLLLCLHLGCTALVYDLARDFQGNRRDASPLPALVLATIFAIHPTRAENVAWISGTTDVAMTFFTLSGLRIFRRGHDLLHLVGGAVLLALGGWCKETAVLAPLLVVAQAFGRGESRAAVRRTVVAASVASALVVLTFYLAVSETAIRAPLPTHEPLFRRVSASLGWFAARTLWPIPATLFPGAYVGGPHGLRPSATWAVLLGLVTVVATGILLAVSIRRGRRGKALVAIAMVLVPLLPVLNIVPRSSTALIADRFLYLPWVGLLLLLAEPLGRLLADGQRWRPVTLAVLGGIVIFSASQTLDSASRFADDLSLFEHEARIHPDSLEAVQAYVDALRGEMRLTEARDSALSALGRANRRRDPEAEIGMALEYLRTQAQLTPEADRAGLSTIRRAYSDVATTRSLAIRDDRLTFQIRMSDVTTGLVMADVGKYALPIAMLDMRTGELQRARDELERLTRSAPRALAAWEMLAICIARQGDFAGAAGTIERARQRFPDEPRIAQTATLIGQASEIAGRLFNDPAMTAVRDANVQLMLGSPGAARNLLVPVLRERPDVLEAIVLLIRVEEADGRPREALRVLDSALERWPGQPVLTELRAAVAPRAVDSNAP